MVDNSDAVKKSELEKVAEEFMQSPGGLIVEQLRLHLRSRINLLLLVVLIGVFIGYPLSERVITWLVNDANLVPSNASTEIIVLSPVELIMLKIRISTYIGLTLATLAFIVDASYYLASSDVVSARMEEADLKIPSPGINLILTFISAIVLLICGFYYSFGLLVPLLLDYLASDAASSGLESQWRLSAFVGFISNLMVASGLGFQVPLVVTILLRNGVVDTDVITRYRRHIWFSAVVLGALLSPPDPLSLGLIAAPMIILFEISLLVDRIV